MAALLLLQGCSEEDEVDTQTAAILKEAPLGTPVAELPTRMLRLGFSCAPRDVHLSCEREESHWLLCTRRTRAILVPINGRLGNVLVNVGRFC